RMRTGYGRGVSRSYLPTLARAEPTPLGRLLLPLPAMPVDEFPRHDRRVDVFEDHLTGDQHAAGVGVAPHLVHHRQQDFLEDRPQPTSARAPQHRLVGDRFQRRRLEFQLDTVKFEEALVLPDERVTRFGQDADERVPVEAADRGDHRQPADELGDQPVLEQVLRHDLAEDVGRRAIGNRPQPSPEAWPPLPRARLDDLREPVESATTDEQDVGGVDLNELLVRVLAPALGWHVGDRALQHLQQRLLHTLTRHVAGYGGVFRLTRDLVDLVDVDDARLRALDVVVRG